MPVGRTKCSRPATIFLSCRIASSISAIETSRDRRQRTQAGDEVGQRRRDRARPVRRAPTAKLGGDEHAVGDRLAVPEAPVFRHRLERVAGRVAEVENAAQTGLPLVRGDDVRLDPARFGDDGVSTAGSRAKIALRSRRDALEQVGLDVMPYLTTSYRPARNSRRGSVPSTDGSIDHGVRLIERADQVLAERVVDADLAADRAVHLREQRRRHVHERDAAQVGRGGEPGHVADDAAAERDERRRRDRRSARISAS